MSNLVTFLTVSPVMLLISTVNCYPQDVGQDDFLSQELFISKVIKSVRDYVDDRPIEKVYIHFDRSFYLTGDTCWYKAYVVDAQLQPTQMSNVLYVDWIAPKGNLSGHQQLKLVNGEAHGDFVFSSGGSEGHYFVRAYTKLMRNEAQDFYFHALINVFNPYVSSSPKHTNGSDTATIDLQFFPEGGALVNGIPSQIAFKAIGPDGKGVDVKGRVVDQLGGVSTFLESGHKGMGVISLTPLPGMSYKAILQTGEIVDLPKAEESGFVMRASNRNKETLQVRVQASLGLLPTNFYLIGQCRRQVCYRGKFSLTNPTSIIEIPKSQMASGVVQLTLFDENGIPRCERMVFVNQEEALTVDVQFDKEEYRPREQVTVSIRVTDQNGFPVETSLSVAICDSDFVMRGLAHENVVTHMLLQSDLKGYVDDPGWYFQTAGPDRVYALDLVMLTNGWRKFNWEVVLGSSYHEGMEYSAEKGLEVQGFVFTSKQEKPVSNAQVTLLTHGKGINDFYNTTTDANGNFTIPDVNFNDSTQFVWQIRDRKGDQIDANVKFVSPAVSPVVLKQASTLLIEQKNESIKQLMSRFQTTGEWNPQNVRVLEGVEVKGTRIDTTTVLGVPSIIPKDYHRWELKPSETDLNTYTDVTKMIADKVPGITFIGWGNDLQVRIRGVHKRLSEKDEEPPLILLDGQPILTDPNDRGGVYNALNIIPVIDIDRIEVMTGAAAAVYGSRGGPGVIAIYSKGSARSTVAKNGPGKGILMVNPPGFDWPREFYQPKYTRQDSVPEIPDHRITLYWNPELKTDGLGQAKVLFFNSDVAKAIQVVAEGLANGIPGIGIKECNERK